MGKIKVTENELRQLIKESVETIIKESMEEDYAKRMAKRNQKYNSAYTNSQKYAKSWNELTPEEQEAYNKRAGGGWNGESIYNDEKNKADNRLKRATRRNGYNFQQQLQGSNTKITKMQADMKAASGQISTALNNALAALNDQVNEAISQDAINVGIANAQEAAFPGLSNILGTIQKLQQGITTLKQNLRAANGKVTQLTKANQTLTAQNSTLNQRVQNSKNSLAQVSAPTNIAAKAAPQATATQQVAKPGATKA